MNNNGHGVLVVSYIQEVHTMKQIRSYAATLLFLDCVPRMFWADVLVERPQRG